MTLRDEDSGTAALAEIARVETEYLSKQMVIGGPTFLQEESVEVGFDNAEAKKITLKTKRALDCCDADVKSVFGRRSVRVGL